MRRLAMTLALTLAATTAAAHEWGDHDGCTSERFGFAGRHAVVAEETIAASNLRTVSVQNAPVSVTGGSGGGYTITVCKAAANASDLAAIQVSVEGGALVTRGPAEKKDWAVTYRITAPNGATLDLESRNGPMAIRNLQGTLNVRLKNGPLSLNGVSGNVDAETTNGPVSLKGGSGTMKIKASNGPVSVALQGSAWNGTLEASTENGPLSLKVPRDFQSGVVVEANGRGPIACRAEACEGQGGVHVRDWDDDRPRRIELGRGPQTVKLTTVNGPVTIKEAE